MCKKLGKELKRKNEKGKSMYDIYDIRGLIKTKDSDYDGLRKLLKDQNISFESLVKKK